jgi:hypothetical protein
MKMVPLQIVDSSSLTLRKRKLKKIDTMMNVGMNT